MRLLLGPPGSGKSTVILNEIRGRLRTARPAFALLVPTATMAEHIRNLLAREGLLVRPKLIQTLAGFLDDLPGGAPVVPQAVLELVTAQVMADRAPAAIRTLADSNGLARAVASAIDELSEAGCDSLRWEALRQLRVVRSSPVTDAFGSVYEGVEVALHEAGLQLRAQRIATAIQTLRKSPPRDVEHVYIDGFFALSSMELKLIQTLATRNEVTLALPEWEGVRSIHAALAKSGAQIQRFHPVRSQPKTILLDTSTRDAEAEQIALRIRELHASGVKWRDCVVVVRGADPYAALLESAFDRLGVPCRSYFATPLAAHPTGRTLSHAVEALLSGFDHALVLDTLRSPVTRSGLNRMFPEFEDRVRRGLPEAGIETLTSMARRLNGGRSIVGDLATLAGLAALARQPRPPQLWPEELRALSRLIAAPDRVDFSDARSVRDWRLRAEAMRLFFASLESAAALMPDAPMALEVFWRESQPVLQSAALRVADHGREAVALIDAYEARQWEAPYVFVCGLVEGEFPRRRLPDAILSDSTRLALNRESIPVGTREMQEDEESFLLEIAFTRPTKELTLSWPKFNEKGDVNLRSFRLESVSALPVASRRVALAARRPVVLRVTPSIESVALQERLAARHETFSPTALESFVQCPFQFYSSRSLVLHKTEPLPEDRLDALVKGDILHRVLAEWHKSRGSIEAVFASVWKRALDARRIPASHKVEHERITMLRALKMFASKAQIEEGWRVYVEEGFELQLNGCMVRGRIDRYDVNEQQEARVFDFKYTGVSGIRRRKQKMDEGLSLQGGLYALALLRQKFEPVSFKYCSVRGEIKWLGTDTPEQTREVMTVARVTSETAAQRIREGDIAVKPADEDACKWCDFRSACRYARQAAEPEEVVDAAGAA